MNTDTGNIFGLDENPLAKNEVELSREEFLKLFPIRDLSQRLRDYQSLREKQDASSATPPAVRADGE